MPNPPASVTNRPVPVENGINTSEGQMCKDSEPVTVSSPKPTQLCYAVDARSGDQLDIVTRDLVTVICCTSRCLQMSIVLIIRKYVTLTLTCP